RLLVANGLVHIEILGILASCEGTANRKRGKSFGKKETAFLILVVGHDAGCPVAEPAVDPLHPKVRWFHGVRVRGKNRRVCHTQPSFVSTIIPQAVPSCQSTRLATNCQLTRTSFCLADYCPLIVDRLRNRLYHG